MSHRAVFRDLTCRKTFICQSCLLTLGKGPPQPWNVRHSSQATTRLKAVADVKSQSSSRLSPRAPPKASNPRRIQDGTEANRAAAALLRELTSGTDEPNVRYFEQDASGKVKPLANEKGFEDSINDLGNLEKEFQEELGSDMRLLLQDLKTSGGLDAMGIGNIDDFATDMEAKLRNVKDIDSFGDSLDSYIKDIENQLEEDGQDFNDLDDLESFMKGDGEQLETRVASKSRKLRPIPQIPENMWTFNQRKRISRLNTLLERVTRESRRKEELTAKTLMSVWKSYNLARMSLAKGWSHVPLDIWDLLWQVLSTEDVHNPNRLNYVSLLARDMSEAKVALNPAQQLLTMEAMFVDGWEPKAIDNWKRCISTLGESGADTFKDFWELGVRMFCQVGDLVQAERAVDKLLERHLDPRILMPYIRSCAEKGSEDGHIKAWEAYRRLRDLLGESMVLEDYDQIISYFLTTNHTENALYAFVDMMSSGRIDLKGKNRLPSQIANKFFFGKWLKRLIGAGDLDGAYSVIKFMRAKGVEASPIQINGLIGAWQRSGGAQDVEKADAVAWDMVKSRLEFVQSRKHFSGLQGPVRLVEVKTSPENGPMPKATLETFSLLAENYRARRLQPRIDELWEAFRQSEISPDAFMLNQLLESHSQSGNIKTAQDLYNSLVNERQVKPDSYTFMALWKMLGANRLHSIPENRLQDEAQLARRLFAETIRFSTVFEAEGIDIQLARKILHTFRRIKDHWGLIVAVRALKEKFNFVPPEALVFEMVLGTTNLAWDTTQTRRKLMVAKNQMDKHVAVRQEQLGQPIMTLAEMTPERRGDELCGYLQRFYLPSFNVTEGDGQLRAVAEEMGVYDIVAKSKA